MTQLEAIRTIAQKAGTEILRHYGKVSATAKADDSPLTAADLAAHSFIVQHLRELTPDIPVLSEESAEEESAGRRQWNRFWLVDPLDGTKEFLKQTGEFTVNIALIEGHRPVLGVVYAPVLELTYWGELGTGSFKQQGRGAIQSLHTRKASTTAPALVASKDHAGPGVQTLFQRFPQATTSSMGSSLKFCLVAEASADVYLRDLPTMEWDTAAAHCVVEAAGGVVLSLETCKPLTYNKESLRNPGFICLGDPSFPWKS